MVYGDRYIFLLINLVKLHNTAKIGGITTINGYFPENGDNKGFKPL